MTHFIQDLQKRARVNSFTTGEAELGHNEGDRVINLAVANSLIRSTALATLEEVEKRVPDTIEVNNGVPLTSEDRGYLSGYNAMRTLMATTLSQLKEAITSNQQSV